MLILYEPGYVAPEIRTSTVGFSVVLWSYQSHFHTRANIFWFFIVFFSVDRVLKYRSKKENRIRSLAA